MKILSKKLYLYILVLIILISSGSFYAFQFNSVIIQTIVLITCMPIIPILLKNHKSIIMLCTFATIVVLSQFISNGDIKEYSQFFLRFLLMYSLAYYCYYKKIDIIHYFVKTIFIISVFYLIVYIIIDVLNINLPYKLSIVQGLIPTRVYFGTYFSASEELILGKSIHRNQGLFWEPGVYQIYLNFALLIKLFYEKKIKKGQIFILIISVITTFSATGMILSVILLLLRIIKHDFKSKKLRIFIRFYALPIISIISIYIIFMIFQKRAIGIQYGNGSFLARKLSIIYSINLFIQKPILGWGFLNYDIINSISNYTVGNVNGLFTLIYQLGLVGLIIWIILPCYYMSKFIYKKHGLIAMISLMLWFLFSINTEPVAYINTILIFTATGYVLWLNSIGYSNKLKECKA